MRKSSVAQAVVDRVERPVVWVDVEPLDPVDQVVRSACTHLRVNVVPGDDPIEALVATMSGRPCLLVLDGVEHLALGVSALVTRLRSATAPIGRV